MTLIATTILAGPKAQIATAHPPAPRAVLSPVPAEKTKAAGSALTLVKAAADNPAATKAADEAQEAAKARRQQAKAAAKEKIVQILDRLRKLKQFASDNPEVMAKQLAQVTKELMAAIKAYAAAGGSPTGGWQTSLNASSPTRDDGTPKSAEEQMRDQVSGSEAAGDMDFLKYAKAAVKKIKEYLEKAKLQTALHGPNKETKEAFDETDATLKEVEKAMDDMDRDIKASSPAAGMFVAMYA